MMCRDFALVAARPLLVRRFVPQQRLHSQLPVRHLHSVRKPRLSLGRKLKLPFRKLPEPLLRNRAILWSKFFWFFWW
jgi:hypothetical protein